TVLASPPCKRMGGGSKFCFRCARRRPIGRQAERPSLFPLPLFLLVPRVIRVEGASAYVDTLQRTAARLTSMARLAERLKVGRVTSQVPIALRMFHMVDLARGHQASLQLAMPA